MNENDCLSTQYKLLKGLFFDDKKETDKYVFCSSKVMDDCFWNLAQIKGNLNKKVLYEIENMLENINRKPSIYVGTNSGYYQNNRKTLLENHYELYGSDVYMVLENKKNTIIKVDIKEVETEKEYDDFMEVLSSAYNGSQENADENVYAGVITECYYKAIKNTIGSKKHKHLIAYDDNVPVAVATLNFADGIGGINSVGTRQGYWNKGYGKQIMSYISNKFEEMKGKTLILSTEYHSKNQKFYEKLGYKELYVMEQYVKNLEHEVV